MASLSGSVNAVTDVIRGTPCTRLAGSRRSARFQSPSWPRRQTVPSVLTATTTPGSAAVAAIRSAPAPRSGEPGSSSGVALTAVSATCSTRPAGSISQRCFPIGHHVERRERRGVGSGRERAAAVGRQQRRRPCAVRTMIVSPMAETRVIARAAQRHRAPPCERRAGRRAADEDDGKRDARRHRRGQRAPAAIRTHTAPGRCRTAARCPRPHG